MLLVLNLRSCKARRRAARFSVDLTTCEKEIRGVFVLENSACLFQSAIPPSITDVSRAAAKCVHVDGVAQLTGEPEKW